MSLKRSRCDDEAASGPAAGGSAGLLPRLAEAMSAAGAAVWGITEAGDVDSAAMGHFDRFIAEGRHATIRYLERYREIRENPLRLLDGSPERGSVITAAFPYTADYPREPEADRIARYALGDDYHDVLRERLKPAAALLREAGFQGRMCVDSAPIMERYWAERAGLGHTGRNHQLIIPGLGSYFFLAEIVTDAVLPETITNTILPPDAADNAPRCAGCGACAAACPGGALLPDGSFDAGRCVNYLTIEHRGELPAAIPAGGPRAAGEREILTAELLRGVLYGCDICQECCPCNSSPAAEPLPEFRPRPALLRLTREALAAMSAEARAELLRRSPLRRGLNRR